MRTITPCLWFDGAAEAAATFYVGTFPDSRIDAIHRSPTDYPAGRAGDVLTVEFTLFGRPFLGLNGGAGHPFTDAVSLMAPCDDQAEVDRIWDRLLADGGTPIVCGWIRDRFGLAWQVFPEALPRMLTADDRAAAARAMQAMMRMVKLDLATLERAFVGSEA